MKNTILTLGFALIILSVNATEAIFKGKEAQDKFEGASLVRYKSAITNPAFIRFNEGQGPKESEINSWLTENFGISENLSFEVYSTEEDELGFKHDRYHQLFNGIEIAYASVIVHSKDGFVVSISGYSLNQDPATSFNLIESAGLTQALNFVNADLYKWEIPTEEALLKAESSDANASYFPKGEKVYLPAKEDFNSESTRACWRFNVYASVPLYRADLFVDAVTGEVILEDKTLKDVDTNTVASTSYSGNRTIKSDYRSVQNDFRLRETGRGNGVRTYDMLNGTNHGNAVDIYSNANFWLDTGRAEHALDAHWGAEMVYDYYLNIHGRNSIDGNGSILRSYVHYDVNYANAFWDGQRMTYGDGNSNASALTTLDIAGHEITHGVDQYTSDLVYQNESGALDESFADIFGNAVEFHNKPDATKNWLVGEEIGYNLRSMSNPKARQDPDTYFGQYWYTGTGDNGGVHTNSGVQNYWFYLLSVGGSGSNDNNDSYSVSGIGIPKAEKIAYRNRSIYLSSFSDYEDARFYSIQSAFDLYGPCSPELASTVNAWYAVGVGNAYSPNVVSDFSASYTEVCFLPATISFRNESNYNSVSYLWDFGDGNSSNQKDPVHTYANPGTYTVKLTALGNSTCGSDTETKQNYINVSPPSDITVGPDYSICVGYAAKLTATGANTIYWYSDATSTSPIHVGNPYISPVLNIDTAYYAANGIPATTDSVGPYDNTIGTGSVFSGDRFIVFDVHNKMVLEKVTVYSYNTGSRLIELRDANGTPILSKLVSIGTGQHEIELNFEIDPGTDYRLGANDADFFRNSNGASYPYTINDLVTITGAGTAPPTYYYFFYNWKVKGSDCVGLRKRIDVTMDLDPNCIPYVGLENGDENNDGISIYPNPSNGIFNLEFDLSKKTNVSLTLLDSKGNMVYIERNKLFEKGPNTYAINHSNLPAGIYLFKIDGDDFNISERLIIQ